MHLNRLKWRLAANHYVQLKKQCKYENGKN